jgi:hypothetical protein
MSRVRTAIRHRPIAFIAGLFLAYATVALMAQQPIGNLPATATASGGKVGLDVNVIAYTDTTLSSILSVLEDILASMSQDATHDSAALSTGPQMMGYGSTSVPTAVTAADAVRAWYTLNGAAVVRQTDGTNLRALDPCETATKTTTAFSVAADAELVDGNASVKTYVCAITFVASAAEVVSIVEGDDGGTCGTNEAALLGNTTDANGMSFAANGGLALGNGAATVLNGITAAADVCITLSGTNRVAGSVTWVQR